ncbi:MAG TPA: polysaccharide biosynthesis C-terminal domain-containing protein [Fulvivirga sp.]|nr:polysaccharide biosynthesis C-terminal domain-containing protein [Fulvivirga sp.]
MSQLKSLAGQTAIYGVSSIFGRLINYALVPLYTTVFTDPGQMGIVTGLYAYTAIFMVIYTFGMETAFFRYARKDTQSAYHLTSTAVIIISTVFSLFIFFFSSSIASLIGYPDTGLFIKWIALILWIDAVLAIPFAKLRHENKARKFAAAKIINIIINILLQVGFLLLLPFIKNNYSIADHIPDIGIGFIFLANLIANGMLFIILFSEIRQLRFRFNWAEFKPILIYSAPIFVMGVAGMFNEQLDKLLLEYMLPDTFYSNMDSTAALGVYGQTFKLGIFMMLAIQAFRYAGEPFFFSKAEDKNAPELFAKVMHYFIIAGLLLFVIVSINVDLIAQLFLRSPAYRVALYLVPLLLFSKLIYGIYVNLSIWFKLSDKTIFGTYFSIVGVVITVLGNVLLIPLIGFMGCVISMIACYSVMAALCYYYGQKYYPIPYKFQLLIPYLVISVAIVYLLDHYHYPNLHLDYAIRIILSGIIIGALYLFEKNKMKAKNI